MGRRDLGQKKKNNFENIRVEKIPNLVKKIVLIYE